MTRYDGEDSMMRLLAGLVGIGEGWRLRARCRASRNRDRWYSNNRAEQRVAKQICAGCPVQEPCYRYALKVGDSWGVWGGVGQGDRRRELRSRAGVASSAT